MRLNIGKTPYYMCNLLILTAQVIVSSLLLPPPPPTSEGATFGAETNKQTNTENDNINKAVKFSCS
jgi:hypothetical protein